MFRSSMMLMTLALIIGMQSAHASTFGDAPSLVVHFADLDLSRSEDAKALYRRLKVAAETVCAALDDRNLAMQIKYTACLQNAIGTAVAKVDRPSLSAYYDTKTNGRKATIQIAKN